MPEEPKTAVIDFFCDITPKSAQTLVSVVNSALAERSTEIVIRLSSEGGSLSPAFAAYHFLRSVKTPMSIYNFGTVESSAVLLCQPGDIMEFVPDGK